jgi:hypothetical protein
MNHNTDTRLLLERYQQVKQRIVQLAEKYQRNPSDIQLLAVSKFHACHAIADLVTAGQLVFGENYVQEMQRKAQALSLLNIEWHFIGPLQSNKCKEVSHIAHTLHSLDRLKLVEPLAKHRPDHLPPLAVCLQMNIDDEISKAGVKDYDTLLKLAKAVLTQPRLQLIGLMTIPAPSHELNTQRQPLAQLRKYRDQLAQDLGMALPTLSMGMSADLEAAIAEGATIVRIGTDIFGPRPKQEEL